ncbi:MAG TPA: glycoside hydrolase family 16 protein [Candidatus Acidoferrales bacterium]|nr:glycoside hydrolase family 16 protein [Candidatus Acidoferrales bacterium]
MRIIAAANFVLTSFLLTIVSSCNSKHNPVSPPGDTTGVPQLPGWTLVWHDEFDSSGIDLRKWNFEVNGNGGGNNELEYYTANPQNAYIDSGRLIIQALKQSYLGKDYTSARITTESKGDWTYGRIEVSAMLPYGQGLWPAIWMMPTDSYYGGWPLSGEIDIMEMLGQQANKIYGTIHYGQSNQQRQGTYTLPSGRFFSNEFHLFAIEWDSVSISWYIDSTMYYKTYVGQPFDRRFFLILNVAVGGDWPGSPDYTTYFPQQMVVDYVRVYKKSN